MYLFPKEFAKEAELKSSNIVLVNKSNNLKIIIPLRSTISLDQNNRLVPSEDEFENITLNNTDLKAIHDQFMTFLNENVSTEKYNNIFSPQSYYDEQDSRIKKLCEKSLKRSTETEKEKVLKRLPTKSELMSASDLIFRSEDEILSYIKVEKKDDDDTQLSSDNLKVYDRLPKTLREPDELMDLSAVNKFSTEFRNWRLLMGLTQLDVVTSMEIITKKNISQSTLCRLESMELYFSNMRCLIPLFRKWLKKFYSIGPNIAIEDVNKKKTKKNLSDDSHSHNDNEDSLQKDKTDDLDQLSDENDVRSRKNRNKRTVFTAAQKKRLEELFQTVKLTQVTMKVYEKVGKEINLDKKIIQTWLTKRRQDMRLEENLKKKKLKMNK